MVSDSLPHACITRVQAQVRSALQDSKHIPVLHHLIATTRLVFINRLQAYVWSAALQYKHMSGHHSKIQAHVRSV